MGYKKIGENLSFADLALKSSLKHNRSLKLMENLNNSIDWSRIETILMNHYTAGTSSEGAKAYPPILLFKCLLLLSMIPIISPTALSTVVIQNNPSKKYLLTKDMPDTVVGTFNIFECAFS